MFVARVLSATAGIIRGRGYYKKYEKMYGRNLKKIPSFKLILKLVQGQVLDVGCGIGYLSILFNNYVGIDVNREALTIAKKNNSGNYIIASASNLPFHSSSFDSCISYDFIEHVQNIEQVLTEMKRVAHKTVLGCVDFGSYYRFFAYDPTHINPLTPDRLILLLKKQFANVVLFKTSGLFKVPELVNDLLAKYFPNQVVAECSSEIDSTIEG